MSNSDSREGTHQHRGKFTEGLLDNDVILKALNILPEQSVLDAGCGNGYMSRLFSEKVGPSGKVFAMDTDKYYIKLLSEETRGTNIRVVDGDVTKSTVLRESSVDLVYVSTVFHGFSEEQILGFLEEVRRVLKQKGVLAIVEMEKKELPFGPPVHKKYSPEELKEIINMHPLDTIRAGKYFYMQTFKRI